MTKININKEVVLDTLKKILGIWDLPILSKVKNIFAWIGVFTSVYLIIFFSFTRPSDIKESEDKISQYQKEIEEFNKQVTTLEKQKLELESEIGGLEKDLAEVEDKSNKNKEKYEKQIRYISNLSNNKLSKLFADTFKEPR